MHTQAPYGDQEPVESREEFEQRARDMAIRLEDEQRYEAIIDEDKRARLEWLQEFQEGAA